MSVNSYTSKIRAKGNDPLLIILPEPQDTAQWLSGTLLWSCLRGVWGVPAYSLHQYIVELMIHSAKSTLSLAID